MHFCNQALFVVAEGGFVFFDLEGGTGVVAVGFHRKGGEGQHADSVAVFERLGVGVAQAEPDDAGDADTAPGRGPHPDDVVVPPLKIHCFELGERVHDEVCPRAAVVHVADDVEVADREGLDQVGEGDDEFPGHVECDDAVEDGLGVDLFGGGGVLVKQGFDEVGEVGGEAFADVGLREFGGDEADEPEQAEDDDAVPLGGVVHLAHHLIHFLFGVVDEGGEAAFAGGAEFVPKRFVYVQPDGPGPVAEHVLERFVLPVDVGHEVFGDFGEFEDGAQVDEFGGGGFEGGELLGEEAEVREGGHIFYHEGHEGHEGGEEEKRRDEIEKRRVWVIIIRWETSRRIPIRRLRGETG